MFTAAWGYQVQKFVDFLSFSPCDSYILQSSLPLYLGAPWSFQPLQIVISAPIWIFHFRSGDLPNSILTS